MLGPKAEKITENAWMFEVPAMLFVTSMATFVRSFVLLKLSLLVLFMAGCLVHSLWRMRVDIHLRLVAFYLINILICIIWSVVGMFHPANYMYGLVDTIRLYVIWSAAFLVLFTLLRSGHSLRAIHWAFVASGILIPLINFVGLYDFIGSRGLIPPSVRAALSMNIGIHDGYIQITSHNIGMLFVIVPYLLSLQLRSDAGKANSGLSKLALVLSLILAAVSGRRALWIAVGLTPFVILLLAWATGSYSRLRVYARRLLATYCLVALSGLAAWSTLATPLREFETVRHVQDAFSAEDERTIQKGYLVDAFKNAPVLGSGFGAYGGYLRNEDRPWIYELTYHQLLFNMGVIGAIALSALFVSYGVLLVALLRALPAGSAVPFGMLAGVCALLIGSYSNPYLSSFDYLFFVGLLPFLSTFQHGFVEDGRGPGDRPRLVQRFPTMAPRVGL